MQYNIFFWKTKVASYDFLLAEKRLTLHNILTIIKSALNKDKNHYYYKMLATIS